MIKVGITGSIGSGKSTVCKIFSLLGIPVYNADAEAKNLINENDELKNNIAAAFGNDIFISEKLLDRKKLASIVFKDADALAKLNSLVHPVVAADFANWVEKNKNAVYVIQEAAVLLESGAFKNVDLVILVTSPEKLRLQRVLLRDNVTEKDFYNRSSNQWNEEVKRKHADFVITNDELQLIIPQVTALHQKILSGIR